MATLLRLPEVAAGATEAVVSTWLVKDGTSVGTGEPLVEIETEKAVVEVAAESDVILLRQLVGDGSAVEVGAPIALLGTASEKDADIDTLLAELGVGDRPPAAEADAPPETVSQPETRKTDGAKRIFMTPIARRILTGAGLPWEEIEGTGPGGRITRRDAEQAIAQAASSAASSAASTDASTDASTAPAPVPAPQATEPPASAKRSTTAPVQDRAIPAAYAGATAIPHSRLRRAIATRLTQSKSEVPHFYLKRTVRLDPLLELRAQLNAVAPEKISVNDLLVKAVGTAHVRISEANVVWTDEALLSLGTADVAVAIASERGLVTPVLRGVENLTPSAISSRIKDFVKRAGEGRLQQYELEGGSIAVSNLGMFGVEEFAAIINPPHSAILAVGAGRPGPVVVDGELRVATTLALTLSVDHRALDGALAARWLDGLVEAIEHPLSLLA